MYDRIYGPLTSAIVLLAWIYLSALILMLGAHISARWQELRTGGPSPFGPGYGSPTSGPF